MNVRAGALVRLSLILTGLVLASVLNAVAHIEEPTERDVDDAIHTVKDHRLATIELYRRCVSAWYNAPTRFELISARENVARARAYENAARVDYWLSRGYIDTLASAIVEKSAAASARAAEAVAAEVEQRRQWAVLGADCVKTLGERYERLISLLYLADTNRPVFRQLVARQMHEYRLDLIARSLELFAVTKTLLEREKQGATYAELSDDLAGHARKLKWFEYRFAGELVKGKFPDLLQPSMAVASNFSVMVSAWATAVARERDLPRLRAEAERAEQEFRERTSLVRALTRDAARLNLATALAEREKALKERDSSRAEAARAIEVVFSLPKPTQ